MRRSIRGPPAPTITGGPAGLLYPLIYALVAFLVAFHRFGASLYFLTLILGAVALAFGLAFGLGNRELAGEITRRWYEEGRRRTPPAAPPPE